jgi:uncharacterized membrane protein (DUF106 family)
MFDFTSLIQSYPRTSIVLIALAISFLITLVNFFVLDKERMREIKKKQKELGEQAKLHQKQGNHTKAMELNKEMLSMAGETFRHTLKPTLITIVPIIVLFAFIRGTYSETIIASSWFWYYLGGAIAGSMIFRKLFNMP